MIKIFQLLNINEKIDPNKMSNLHPNTPISIFKTSRIGSNGALDIPNGIARLVARPEIY